MAIEFEATFANINKNEIRQRLTNIGAELLRPEFMQKRVIFRLEDDNMYVRVRDEGDKVTLTYKHFKGDKIDDQIEHEIEVDNFETATKILQLIGLEQKAYQETTREIWLCDGVHIMIDTWPFTKPFVEIEGDNEQVVKDLSDKLGFNYIDAIFGPVHKIIQLEYPNITKDQINNQTPLITFDMPVNPFMRE